MAPLLGLRAIVHGLGQLPVATGTHMHNLRGEGFQDWSGFFQVLLASTHLDGSRKKGVKRRGKKNFRSPPERPSSPCLLMGPWEADLVAEHQNPPISNIPPSRPTHVEQKITPKTQLDQDALTPSKPSRVVI